MANEEDTGKTDAEMIDRVWELADKIRICMLTTWDGKRQRSRPLYSHPDRKKDIIQFLVDEHGAKTWQVDQFPWVSLSYVDTSGNKYVALTGKAKITNDRKMIKKLWSDFNKAWWDSEDDPAIRLLTIEPDDAEIWDSPNKLVAGLKMLAAAVTGAKPRYGDHAKVDI